MGFSLDIKSAHKLVVIRPSDRGLLDFTLDGDIYFYKVAPFGARSVRIIGLAWGVLFFVASIIFFGGPMRVSFFRILHAIMPCIIGWNYHCRICGILTFQFPCILRRHLFWKILWPSHLYLSTFRLLAFNTCYWHWVWRFNPTGQIGVRGKTDPSDCWISLTWITCLGCLRQFKSRQSKTERSVGESLMFVMNICFEAVASGYLFIEYI